MKEDGRKRLKMFLIRHSKTVKKMTKDNIYRDHHSECSRVDHKYEYIAEESIIYLKQSNYEKNIPRRIIV